MPADRGVLHVVQLEELLGLGVLAGGDEDLVTLRAESLDDRPSTSTCAGPLMSAQIFKRL